MSISDCLREAIHGMLDYLYDEVGQRQGHMYDDAWVQAELMPALTPMTTLLYALGTPPGRTAPDPLRCEACQLTFPDVLQSWHHFEFSSAHIQHRLVDEAMLRAGQRPDIDIVSRGDLMPLGEVALDDDMDGQADIIEVEGFVLSIPADCPHCREYRDRLSQHMTTSHPKPIVP